MCRKSRFNSKSHLAECCSFIFNPFMTLSYRNQSIDLQWIGFYMITASVMKGLKEIKQVALASEASKTFLDFITQHQVLVMFILMK